MAVLAWVDMGVLLESGKMFACRAPASLPFSSLMAAPIAACEIRERRRVPYLESDVAGRFLTFS